MRQEEQRRIPKTDIKVEKSPYFQLVSVKDRKIVINKDFFDNLIYKYELQLGQNKVLEIEGNLFHSDDIISFEHYKTISYHLIEQMFAMNFAESFENLSPEDSTIIQLLFEKYNFNFYNLLEERMESQCTTFQNFMYTDGVTLTQEWRLQMAPVLQD